MIITMALYGLIFWLRSHEMVIFFFLVKGLTSLNDGG